MMQNSTQIHNSIEQKFILTKSFLLSLKILTFHAADLYHFLEDSIISNHALDWLNHKSMQKTFSHVENTSEFERIDVLDSIDQQIQSSKIENRKKTFLIDVLHHYLDANFYLNEKLFSEKYSSEKYRHWLSAFKHFTPVGVAVRSLQERLKHQLEYNGLKYSLAYRIVDECWKCLRSQQFSKIQKLLKCTKNEMEIGFAQIKKCELNFHSQNKSFAETLLFADVILHNDNTISLNNALIPQVQLNKNWVRQWSTSKNGQAKLFAKTQIKEAKNIINCILKRNESLLKIVTCIVDFKLKPSESKKRLTLKTIALQSALSQSTISRTLKNKSILTRDGIKTMEQFLKSPYHCTNTFRSHCHESNAK